MDAKKLRKFDLGQIKPLGYLKRQLEVQAEGLSGNLPSLMDEASDNSAWLGGKGDGWERGPYYVYGLLSLGVMLEDKRLLAEVDKWINKIIASAGENGMYGPEKSNDWWPRMVVNKLLCDYYEYNPQQRILDFLNSYYSYMLANIDDRPFSSWAWARGFEELVNIDRLYRKTGNAELLEVAEKIKRYSLDWAAVFADYPYKKPSAAYMGRGAFNVRKVTFFAGDFIRNVFGEPRERVRAAKISKKNSHPFSVFYHLTHGVNLAMALKYPAYQKMFFDSADTSRKGYMDIIKYHGTANGLFTCDEHVMGTSPVNGTELCTVVEAMYSFQKLLEITGDPYWADRLELVGFSALPATFMPDMCSHQYVQQANQISATSAKRLWYDSYNNANIFGLKPNYACCLANMHQGFPKLAEHLSMLDGDTVCVMIPAPHRIERMINGEKIRIEITGKYPFEPKSKIKVTEGSVTVRIRKPGYSAFFTVNGQKFDSESADFFLKKGESFEVVYDRLPQLIQNPDGTYSIMLGNLLMALPISYIRRIKKSRGRFSDLELLPDSDWQYVLADVPLEGSVCKPCVTDADYPFSYPPLALTIKAHKADWTTEHNSSSTQKPENIQIEPCEIKLVPYCTTSLRISHFFKK